jgi:hypothetical protein
MCSLPKKRRFQPLRRAQDKSKKCFSKPTRTSPKRKSMNSLRAPESNSLSNADQCLPRLRSNCACSDGDQRLCKANKGNLQTDPIEPPFWEFTPFTAQPWRSENSSLRSPDTQQSILPKKRAVKRRICRSVPLMANCAKRPISCWQLSPCAQPRHQELNYQNHHHREAQRG